MLEQLFNLVKEQGQETVINNPEVPNEKNGEVMAEATNSIMGGLQNVLAGGGLQSILGLFGQGGGNAGGGSMGISKNPIVNMIAGHFMSKLMGKFGMSNSAAAGIAGQLIPNVLGGLINKTQDPSNNGFSLEGLLGSLMGGGAPAAQAQPAAASASSGIGGLLSSVLGKGLDRDGDGDTDFQDLMGMVTGGAQQAAGQRASGGGGFMDILQGLIK